MSLALLVGIGFFSAYFGIFIYVFYRLGSMLSFRRWLAAALLFAFAFPLVSILEHTFSNVLTRLLYGFFATVLGAVWLALWVLLALELLRPAVGLSKRAAGLVALIAVGFLTLFGLVNAVSIEIRTVEVPIAGLEKEVKIAQLSDVHLGSLHNERYLRKVVEKTNRLEPDIVVITGDLVDGSGRLTEECCSVFNELNAEVYAVTGNHEMYSGIAHFEALLSGTKIVVLRNETIVTHGIQLIGVDHPQNQFTRANSALQRMEISGEMPSVLLYHLPSGLDDANNAGIDLQLSGHTHAGQVAPFNLFVRLAYPMQRGLYQAGSTLLYVSQGTGTWGPPMRIGSRSEIADILLVPA